VVFAMLFHFSTKQGDALFNKGMMMNIGYKEAKQRMDFDCFIFHDVDLIPFILQNYYGCVDLPRHLGSALDSYFFAPLYATCFGGAITLNSDQMEKTNGFTNLLYGWGGEDDDMFNRLYGTSSLLNQCIADKFYRLKRVGLTPCRYPAEISSYLALKHDSDPKNPKTDRR
jgi:hypothetical protein